MNSAPLSSSHAEGSVTPLSNHLPALPPPPLPGEAITFFMEDDAGQLRGVANVMRAAGCDVPDWMLQLKKERRHRKPAAPPAAGRISTEPLPEGGKAKGQWRQKGGGGKGRQQQQGGKKGQKRPAEQQQRQQGGGKPAKLDGSGKQQPAQKKARKDDS